MSLFFSLTQIWLVTGAVQKFVSIMCRSNWLLPSFKDRKMTGSSSCLCFVWALRSGGSWKNIGDMLESRYECPWFRSVGHVLIGWLMWGFCISYILPRGQSLVVYLPLFTWLLYTPEQPFFQSKRIYIHLHVGLFSTIVAFTEQFGNRFRQQ